MNKNSVTLRPILKIKDPSAFVKTVYDNFSYLTEPELNHTVEEIRRVVTSPDFFGLLMYNSDGRIIAYLVGEFKNLADGRYVYYITYMFVSPRFRGRKLGSRMVNKLAEHCTTKGVRFIILTCDSTKNKLVNFYRNLGFMDDPVIKTNNQHIVMCRYL